MSKFLFIFLALFTFSNAGQTILNSSESKVSLIELYTSQGCSSCPVADEWLSDLKNDKKLFKEYIPMAFHVTYWDYIGWKDIFANKLNDTRQKNYSIKVWKKNSVYTPQFIVDSKEYRQWFFGKAFPKLNKTYGGNLKAILDENKNLKVDYFNEEIKNKEVMVNIAVLGFDYSVNIKSGENRSRTLKHDFVVLDHTQKFGDIKNNKLNFETKLYKLEKIKNKKLALAVWISDYNYNNLQATAGFIK